MAGGFKRGGVEGSLAEERGLVALGEGWGFVADGRVVVALLRVSSANFSFEMLVPEARTVGVGTALAGTTGCGNRG